MSWGATLRRLCSPRPLADLGVATALWLLVAGSLHLQEVVVAALVGLVVAIIGIRVRAEVDHRNAAVARLVPTLLRQYLGAHRDCWRLIVALLRQPVGRAPAGRLRTVPFVFGDAGPGAVGRRVATTLVASLRPNSYVLGFERERGLILVHELLDDGEELLPSTLTGSARPAPGPDQEPRS